MSMVEGRGGFATVTAQPMAEAASPGLPVLRWSSRARSIDGVARELGKIWVAMAPSASPEVGGERRVAARSSVMNLVVIAVRGESGERAAAIIEGLTGRHPSRTLIVAPADPDGPSWIDAQIEAHCMMPSETSPETCSELVYLTCGGESGQHMASLPERFNVEIVDFALLRQARWREAIASTFDRPNLLPFLGFLDRVDLTFAVREGAPGTNVVRPTYHVAWLASRLGMSIEQPLRAGADPWTGYTALLRLGRRRVPITIKPVQSDAPRGTTI